ncbi:MAG: reverse transcriptase family protein [Cetobacterium sp.]
MGLYALIDSGAAGNFMSWSFIQTHNVPVIPCISPLAVEAIDGRSIRVGRITHLTGDLSLQVGDQHQERLSFHAIHSPRHALILGLPWLRLHNPTISWPELHITSWGDSCSAHLQDSAEPCQLNTTDATPISATIPGLPHEYQDLEVAFSETKATELPPHRSCDCAINLLPGATPPRERIFPLSQPEATAMTEYIQEELKKGFIRPSVSPASSGFFFVKKRDGGLRPCIDYRALNDITVKFRYPLPLMPSALEQLRRARFFTKLDLRCAYNLIRIRQGDEWNYELRD